MSLRQEGDQNSIKLEQSRQPVIWRVVPEQAGLLAQEVAEHFSGNVRQPLVDFLQAAAMIENLEGVGLIIWEAPLIIRSFTVFPFTDFTGLARGEGFRPRKEFRQLYSEKLVGKLQPQGIPIGVSHVDTCDGVSRALEAFPYGLDNPFMGKPDPNERIILARIALPQRNKSLLIG